MSMHEFNTALGFDCQNTTCDFPDDFDNTAIYVELCDNPSDLYSSTRSKDLHLSNHCLKYLHRFLAYTFSGRKDATNILIKTDFTFFGVWYIGRSLILDFGLPHKSLAYSLIIAP